MIALWYPGVSPAAEPFEIQTAQGKYKVIEIPEMPGPFEVTADYRWAVALVDGQYQVFSLADGKPIGEPRRLESSEWKVLGQELIVADTTSWSHYSLPELEVKSRFPTPPPAIGSEPRSRGAVTYALAYGWCSNGFVYDDDHSKIVATFRGPAFYNDPNMENGRCLRNDTNSCIPCQLEFSSQGLYLAGYDRLPIRGIDKPQYRCGLKWFTAAGRLKPPESRRYEQLGKFGVYVEFVGPHFQGGQNETLYHWWGSVPLVLDATYDPAEWKIKALPNMTPIDAAISIDPIDENSQHELIASFNKAPLENAEAIIENYAKWAELDFELITGRKPKGIPLALLVTFQGSTTSRQVVWTEMTKEQILARFAGGMRKRKAEADAKEAVLRNEAAVRQHQEMTNSIQQQNARFKSAPPRFVPNFQSYAGYSAMIAGFAVTALVTAFLLNKYKRRLDALAAEASDDLVLVPSEPPVISP